MVVRKREECLTSEIDAEDGSGSDGKECSDEKVPVIAGPSSRFLGVSDYRFVGTQAVRSALRYRLQVVLQTKRKEK